MTWFSLLFGLALLSLVVCEKYTDRYDAINVDDILANRRLLIPYVKCMLDQGRCTPEGKELKMHVKDGMQSACSKCTDAQKHMARKVVAHLRQNEPQFWENLKIKYDPGNEFRDIYESFLAAKD